MLVFRAARGPSRAVDAELAHIADGPRDAAKTLLDRYLEGWAEVSPRKIFAATAPDYCLHDPLIGVFSRWSITSYLERLKQRVARAGAFKAEDLAIFIRGPMDGSRPGGPLTFFREAPRLGLTGISLIALSDRGVVAETVAYDLNLASELLRHPA
jgi:hypothetical protein